MVGDLGGATTFSCLLLCPMTKAPFLNELQRRAEPRLCDIRSQQPRRRMLRRPRSVLGTPRSTLELIQAREIQFIGELLPITSRAGLGSFRAVLMGRRGRAFWLRWIFRRSAAEYFDRPVPWACIDAVGRSRSHSIDAARVFRPIED